MGWCSRLPIRAKRRKRDHLVPLFHFVSQNCLDGIVFQLKSPHHSIMKNASESRNLIGCAYLQMKLACSYFEQLTSGFVPSVPYDFYLTSTLTTLVLIIAVEILTHSFGVSSLIAPVISATC